MNYKSLLKFYFRAEELNGALDALIFRYAACSFDSYRGCEYYADKINKLIEVKGKLGELYAFLDGVIASVTDEDRRVLEAYSMRRRKCTRGGSLEAAGKGRGEASVGAAGGGEDHGNCLHEEQVGCVQSEEGGKALHRSLMKFSRRLKGRLIRFSEQVKVLREYYCFLGCGKSNG